LKKPAGSVRFRFYNQKTKKTEPNRTETDKKPEKNRAKPSHKRAKPEKPSQNEKTEPNQKKPSQNRKNRAKLV
jgi:hypothetical protein